MQLLQCADYLSVNIDCPLLYMSYNEEKMIF